MYNTITANKTGGCGALVEYLEKEKSLSGQFADYLDKESQLQEEQGYFFNGDSHLIEKEEVINGIDRNCKGLKLNESRFFSLTFNPSANEIRHLEKLAEAQVLQFQRQGILSKFEHSSEDVKQAILQDMLRQYIVRAMDSYALNFGREGISSNKDLVWFGRIEKDRYWKHSSSEVRHNRAITSKIKKLMKSEASPARDANVTELRKQYILESQVRSGGKHEPIYDMMPKNGNNWHAHVVVSRRDKTQTKSLSPLAKARSNEHHMINGRECKAGFHRDQFTQMLESTFDKNFEYSRAFRESYEGRKALRETPELYRAKEAIYNAERGITRQEAAVLERDSLKRQSEALNMATSLTNTIAQEAGLNYIDSSSKPYKMAASAGNNLMRTAIRRRNRAIAQRSAQQTRTTGKTVKTIKSIKSKAMTASKMISPVSATVGTIKDIGAELIKGFARGIT